MSNHSITASVVALLAATTLGAQAPTRSKPDQRITISKGEVALPKVDTLYITRYDTVMVTRSDTVRVPFTVVRIDTVIQKELVMPEPAVLGPVYLAFYTGTTIPSGRIDRLYTTGFHGGGIIGWDDDYFPFGARLSATYTQLSRENGALRAAVGTTTPMMASFGLDLKIAAPGTKVFRLYGIGGASFNMYKGLATVADGRGMANVDGRGGWYEPVDGSRWSNKFGYSAGGGADFTFGEQPLFFEARASALRANGAHTWFIPVSLGVRFF